jgi:hypothetical protein
VELLDDQTVKTPAENFTGDVYLDPVFNDDEAPRRGPGPLHPRRPHQLALPRQRAAARVHRRRRSGCQPHGSTIRLRVGESVWTPPGQEHWHGGTLDTMMCRYAILDETAARDATMWLEPVTDEQYAAANKTDAITT